MVAQAMGRQRGGALARPRPQRQGLCWRARWPADPEGSFCWSLRVPPALTAAALERLPRGWRYLAIHGVGAHAATQIGFLPKKLKLSYRDFLVI